MAAPLTSPSTVLVTLALAAHPDVRDNDLLLNIPTTLMANFGPHWLVMSALKTESDYVVEYGAVHANMAQVQTSGIPIMMDDFGTGSSNLERLSEVRANVLKIDRRFIAAISCATDDAPLVQSILGLARGLGSSVIAEGVETDVQADWLEDHACRFAQGYLFSRPVASADLAAVCAGLSP